MLLFLIFKLFFIYFNGSINQSINQLSRYGAAKLRLNSNTRSSQPQRKVTLKSAPLTMKSNGGTRKTTEQLKQVLKQELLSDTPESKQRAFLLCNAAVLGYERKAITRKILESHFKEFLELYAEEKELELSNFPETPDSSLDWAMNQGFYVQVGDHLEMASPELHTLLKKDVWSVMDELDGKGQADDEFSAVRESLLSLLNQ